MVISLARLIKILNWSTNWARTSSRVKKKFARKKCWYWWFTQTS